MKERKLPGASGAIHKLARARHALRSRTKTYHLFSNLMEKPTIKSSIIVYFTVAINIDVCVVLKADELQRLNGAVQWYRRVISKSKKDGILSIVFCLFSLWLILAWYANYCVKQIWSNWSTVIKLIFLAKSFCWNLQVTL